jgi:hypothetical protein
MGRAGVVTQAIECLPTSKHKASIKPQYCQKTPKKDNGKKTSTHSADGTDSNTDLFL